MNLSNAKLINAISESKWIQPVRIVYRCNGTEYTRDIHRVSDGVACVIYNTTTNRLVFVKQFRPAVYIGKLAEQDSTSFNTEKYPVEFGLTMEFCAGCQDQVGVTAKQMVRSEIVEETGYDVSLEAISEVISYRAGLNSQGYNEVLFYAEVTEANKQRQQQRQQQQQQQEQEQIITPLTRSDEQSFIEVVELSPTEAYDLIFDETVSRSPALLFGIQWWLDNKAPRLSTA